MKIEVRRLAADGIALTGQLFINGLPCGFTLENGPLAIPPDTYPVVLTESPHVHEGRLWSPDASGVLPLVCNVKGRSGIRLHALNEAAESDGCIGVGTLLRGSWLSLSRAKLTEVMGLMQKAVAAKEAITLTVVGIAQTPPTNV